MEKLSKIFIIILVIQLSAMTMNCFAYDNIYVWKEIKIEVPSNMILIDKDDMAIIASNAENPINYLIIYESNSTVNDILKNLNDKKNIVEIQDIKNENIAMYDCTIIKSMHKLEHKEHISFIFNKYDVKIIYVGLMNDFTKYKKIIQSLKIND